MLPLQLLPPYPGFPVTLILFLAFKWRFFPNSAGTSCCAYKHGARSLTAWFGIIIPPSHLRYLGELCAFSRLQAPYLNALLSPDWALEPPPRAPQVHPLGYHPSSCCQCPTSLLQCQDPPGFSDWCDLPSHHLEGWLGLHSGLLPGRHLSGPLLCPLPPSSVPAATSPVLDDSKHL